MGSNEKPITDLTLSIKVQIFFSIIPFCNGVLGAHYWDMISCSIWKGSNLLNTLPQSNRSVLICLPYWLSDSALKLTNLSRASNFLSIYIYIYISKTRVFINVFRTKPVIESKNLLVHGLRFTSRIDSRTDDVINIYFIYY